jgi:predicted transcriptional regulator of viral defense system
MNTSTPTDLNRDALQAAVAVIKEHGGMLRASQALRAGIRPRTLYQLRDAGTIQQFSRGTYRLSELPQPSRPDLLQVALRIPRGVLCLVSALAYHGLTTQIPHAVSIALARGTTPPRLVWPPLHVYWFSDQAYTAGVEQMPVDGAHLAVYEREKTLADCFKYRNKLGLDVCLEALRLYRDQRAWRMDILQEYANICRVQHVMQPYLEALWSEK